MRVASTLSTTPSRARDDGDAGVARHDALHAGADERRIGAEQRHRLALHVGAHEGAVGVVVLEERDQRGGDADTSWFGDTSMNSTCSGGTMVNSPPMRAETRSAVKCALGVERRVRLRDDVCSSSSSAER